MFVRERTARPVGLRPHIEQAFEQPSTSIDFSGYTAETLHGVIPSRSTRSATAG